MSKARRDRSRVTPPKKRRVHYEARLGQVQPLLYPRQFTMRRLNVSLAYVLRLEKSGVLTPIRLHPGSTSQVFHRSSEVDGLAQGEKA